MILEGDNVPHKSIEELIKYYTAFDIKAGWCKLKQPIEKVENSTGVTFIASPIEAKVSSSGSIEEISLIEARMECIYQVGFSKNKNKRHEKGSYTYETPYS